MKNGPKKFKKRKKTLHNTWILFSLTCLCLVVVVAAVVVLPSKKTKIGIRLFLVSKKEENKMIKTRQSHKTIDKTRRTCPEEMPSEESVDRWTRRRRKDQNERQKEFKSGDKMRKMKSLSGHTHTQAWILQKSQKHPPKVITTDYNPLSRVDRKRIEMSSIYF